MASTLHTQFRDITCKYFEKHGMTVVGFWNPTDPKEAKTILDSYWPTLAVQRRFSANIYAVVFCAKSSLVCFVSGDTE